MRRLRIQTRSPSTETGLALIAVLVVTMLSSMIAIGLLYRVRAESSAAAAGRGGQRAWNAALSGVHHAAEIVNRYATTPAVWTDNPGLFREQLVDDDGADRWYFTVYSPGDNGNLRHGVTDESSKFNVHAVDQGLLERIPGISTPIAEAILDYLDPPGEPRSGGVEQDYYDALPVPYRIRNGRIGTLEELLLVRGCHAALVYGEDANLNHRLDEGEDDGDESPPPDNADGILAGGLRRYLTVWNIGRSVDVKLRPRIDLDRDVDRLAELDVPDETLAFIAAVRGNSRGKAKKGARAGRPAIRRPVDLLDASGEFAAANGSVIELHSGVGPKALSEILDRTETRQSRRDLARQINVNTAAAKVLALVPGIDSALARTIVERRSQVDPVRRRTPAWLLTEGLVEVSLFKRIVPWLSARGFQYRMQVVGYGVPSGRYRVIEVIVDTGRDRPRIVYLRDLTRLGLPFAVKPPVTPQTHPETAASRPPVSSSRES